ncbi:MAG TPA: hypothetical protein VGM94_08530 [Galbitalea sp.]|jgi:hypothetical protein
MLPTYCPVCRTIRQPNGQFCHVCGYSYVERRPVEPEAAATRVADPRLSMADGFRFGIGFFTAAILFAVLFTIFSSVLFATILGTFLHAFSN